MANSNLFLSPYEILQIDQENKYLRKLSYFIMKLLARWLSWMRRPTGDQEVVGSTPAEVGNILSWRLIVKYFLRSSSPFH